MGSLGKFLAGLDFGWGLYLIIQSLRDHPIAYGLLGVFFVALSFFIWSVSEENDNQ